MYAGQRPPIRSLPRREGYVKSVREPKFEEELDLQRAFGEERLHDFVEPYHLKLMSFGAASAGTRLAHEVRRKGKELDLADVDHLLRMPWRPRVMGAWFAVAAGEPTLSDALHDSLETCLGHLTAPPLIVGMLIFPTVRTQGLLLEYAQADRDHGWGASGFAAAAAARATPDNVRPGQDHAIRAEDVTLLDAMLKFADALRMA